MIEPADPYERIARYYDAENADKDDDLPLYLHLAEEIGAKSALVAGCGTGRVVFPLAKVGLRVTGVDSSEAMLALARKHAEARKLKSLTWVQADIRNMKVDEKFDLVIFPYNGLMHLIEQADQLAALTALAKRLAPQGALLIDVHNPIDLFRYEDSTDLALERIFTDAETGQQVMQQSVVQFDRAAQHMFVTWVYDRIGPQGQVFRDLIPMQFRLTFAPELALLGRAAGLERASFFGDYELGDYVEESPRLIALLERDSV